MWHVFAFHSSQVYLNEDNIEPHQVHGEIPHLLQRSQLSWTARGPFELLIPSPLCILPGWVGAAVTSVRTVLSWPQAAPEWLPGTRCPRPRPGCVGTAMPHWWLKSRLPEQGQDKTAPSECRPESVNAACLHYTSHFFLTYAPRYTLHWPFFLTPLTI